MIIRYHVFTDGVDDFFSQDELEEAVALVRKHLDAGQANVRLYKERYASPEDLEDDVMLDEICLICIGDTPA